jgi:transcriptional regulator with XRE-family HTH domain
MDVKARFGKKIRGIRLSKKLSQEKLALIANIDRTYIPSIEKGERNVSIGVAEKLAKALGVQLFELFK